MAPNEGYALPYLFEDGSINEVSWLTDRLRRVKVERIDLGLRKFVSFRISH